MADLFLPEKPLFQSVSPAPIVIGGWQTPPTGGEDTWLGYMGNRMSAAFVTPKLKPEPDGRNWTSVLLDAYFSGKIVACRFPQPGFHTKAIAAPGAAIVVDGAGQAGSFLNVRGLEPGSEVQHEFFSVVTGGRRTLYRVTRNVIVGADGKAAVPIAPILHVQPQDGDICEFGTPMIEGKLTGDSKAWTMVIGFVQGLSFTITETR